MLTVNNFETQIPAVILQRGKDYFNNGNVISLEETGRNIWNAEVEGSDTYAVEVTLEKDNAIADYFCDCPFEGDTCKHVAAVFFALQHKLSKNKNEPKKSPKKDVFENILQSISLEEYQDFIRTQAAKNKNFKTEFELFFAGKDNRIDVVEKYTELVTKLIKKHSDKGFIDYRASTALAREIDKLLATGFSYVTKENFKDAFALAKAFLKPMMQAITDADDSNGAIANSIDKTISLLQSIANADAAVTIKEQIFQFLQSQLDDKIYFEYGDFGYDLFAIFQSLAVQLNYATEFMAFIDAHLTNGGGRYDNYRNEYFQKRKIEFLQLTGKAAEAKTLVQQSMDIAEVRAEQVNKAMLKKDFALAKKLVNEGIGIAEKKKHHGTVTEWQQALLQIALLEKDIAAIRQYTKYFAFDNGFSKEYYQQWKKTYIAAEWTKIIETHIAGTMHIITQEWHNERFYKPAHPNFLYQLAPVYIEEKFWDRLLALVQQEKDLDLVLQFHPFLINHYPEELLSMYLPMLEAYAVKADNRSEYTGLVKKMQKIIKDIPAGKEKITALAQQLKNQFSVKPRRPAMIEELNKILK